MKGKDIKYRKSVLDVNGLLLPLPSYFLAQSTPPVLCFQDKRFIRRPVLSQGGREKALPHSFLAL